MNRKNYINGFFERVDQVCFESGLTRSEICKRMGYDRKALYESSGFSTLKLARFCAVTGTDANWLLGLSRERKKDESIRVNRQH